MQPIDLSDTEIRTERLLLRPFRQERPRSPGGRSSRGPRWRGSSTGSRAHARRREGRWRRRIAATQPGGATTTSSPSPSSAARTACCSATSTIFLRSVEHRQVEVGYVFHPDAGGQGYATEATRALVDFAFADLDAHRVFARTDARNDRLRRPPPPPRHAPGGPLPRGRDLQGRLGRRTRLRHPRPRVAPVPLSPSPAPPRYDPDPSGAVAQLAKAPVSKTGDSRFESWLPRLRNTGLQSRICDSVQHLKNSGLRLAARRRRNRSGMRAAADPSFGFLSLGFPLSDRSRSRSNRRRASAFHDGDEPCIRWRRRRGSGLDWRHAFRSV